MQCVRFAVGAVAAFMSAWASGDVTIRGQVTDTQGRPVGRALVFWLRPAPINSYPPSIDGQADERGLFSLTLAGPETVGDVHAESVVVYAEGHGLGVTNVRTLAQQDVPAAAVVLPGESNTAFRVVDPRGQVLAGELVEPVVYSDGGVSKLPATFVQAVGQISDGNGLVRFPALASERLRTVRVVSENFGPQQMDVRLVQPSPERTIALRAAGRVEVTFDTSAGRMGKCKMLAFTMAPQQLNAIPGVVEQGHIQGAYAEFFDDPKGFVIPALAEGLLRFQLSGCTNQEPVLPHWPEKTELKPGETRKFTVPFVKTVTIRGRVLERGTGKPCTDAEVFIYTRDAGCSILTHPDSEGRYSCRVLPGPVSSYATRRFAPGHPSSQRSEFLESVVGSEGYEFPDQTLDPTIKPEAR